MLLCLFRQSLWAKYLTALETIFYSDGASFPQAGRICRHRAWDAVTLRHAHCNFSLTLADMCLFWSTTHGGPFWLCLNFSAHLFEFCITPHSMFPYFSCIPSLLLLLFCHHFRLTWLLVHSLRLIYFVLSKIVSISVQVLHVLYVGCDYISCNPSIFPLYLFFINF